MATLSAKTWLRKNKKAPFETPYFHRWYWGLEKEDTSPEDLDFVIPKAVFDQLVPETEYPDVKSYNTCEDAINDFCDAFNKAKESGWNPCQ